MNRLFIDMDGTVAKWENCGIDEVAQKGYFANREPMQNMVNAIEHLGKWFELVIVSAVFNDDHSVEDKKEWLRKEMPFLNTEDAVFVPYGVNKYEYLRKRLSDRGQKFHRGDVFLDDYTKNLIDIKDSGDDRIIPIKVLNGINDTNKTWKGFRLSSESDPETIACTVLALSEYLS